MTPLTALKFAELSVRAGIPKGVINIVTGSGTDVGQAIADHPLVAQARIYGINADWRTHNGEVSGYYRICW